MKSSGAVRSIRHAAGFPQPNRRERRRLETRERIYRAALQIFAERGYLETTVEDITEAADVGKGTFFNYFPTKEHVLATYGEQRVAAIERRPEESSLGKPLRASRAQGIGYRPCRSVFAKPRFASVDFRSSFVVRSRARRIAEAASARAAALGGNFCRRSEKGRDSPRSFGRRPRSAYSPHTNGRDDSLGAESGFPAAKVSGGSLGTVLPEPFCRYNKERQAPAESKALRCSLPRNLFDSGESETLRVSSYIA